MKRLILLLLLAVPLHSISRAHSWEPYAPPKFIITSDGTNYRIEERVCMTYGARPTKCYYKPVDPMKLYKNIEDARDAHKNIKRKSEGWKTVE